MSAENNSANYALPQSQLSALEQFIKLNGLPIARGIEKEGLRCAENFDIAQSSHPSALGHPLTHSSITTDYSEALLELITPVENTRDDLLNTLQKTHQYVARSIDNETMWAGSMPCRLNGEESIRIAEYGDSNIGKLKYVYREGLGVRYGKVMQSIAGLHFNFSLSDDFWKNHQIALGDTEKGLQDFKSEQYFALIRNFRRYSWILMYLFGASPTLDKSFLDQQSHNLDALDDKGSYYKPYATSLRMGDLGYHNNAQSSLAICFNNLNNFTTTLGKAIHTPYAEYEKIGLKSGKKFIQINTNILQIENEYYSSIRPKRTIFPTETPRHALNERGVEYIEVRCLDLNPFLPLGISAQQIDFLDTFLFYCLMKESPIINDKECAQLDKNFDLAVNEGRKPGLTLKNEQGDITLVSWLEYTLKDMQNIAQALDLACDDNRYQQALTEQAKKAHNADLCPSAEVLAVMKHEKLSWLEFAGELSQKHKTLLAQDNESSTQLDGDYAQYAKQSFLQAETIKQADTINFEAFLKDYQTE
jgi:glutamate--cysteine ligase